jgi:hypothetical protein
MNKIHNIEMLRAEIERLEAEVSFKECNIRKHTMQLKESLKPANLLSAGFRKIIEKPSPENSGHFVKDAAKAGLMLLFGKIMFSPGEKTKQRIFRLVDKAFDKTKNLFTKKEKRSTEHSFYKFDDEYDSESN